MVLLMTALLIPAVRNFVDQTQQLSQSRAQEAALEAELLRLDSELARWEDEVFIRTQARTRLSYMTPGDTVWRPVGGEALNSDVDPATGIQVKVGMVGATAGQPWFDALLESIRVASGPTHSTNDRLEDIFDNLN
jgi:hypothetical protein